MEDGGAGPDLRLEVRWSKGILLLSVRAPNYCQRLGKSTSTIGHVNALPNRDTAMLRKKRALVTIRGPASLML
jgi:hypothetical protein